MNSLLFRNQRFIQGLRPVVGLGIFTPQSLLQQVSYFSKYISKQRAKRLPLTTKRAGKGYYKGNRSRKEGWLDSKGHFHRVNDWCTELVVPDLTNFPLKPYVGAGAKRHIIDSQVSV